MLIFAYRFSKKSPGVIPPDPLSWGGGHPLPRPRPPRRFTARSSPLRASVRGLRPLHPPPLTRQYRHFFFFFFYKLSSAEFSGGATDGPGGAGAPPNTTCGPPCFAKFCSSSSGITFVTSRQIRELLTCTIIGWSK
jgi:hypothetical protein